MKMKVSFIHVWKYVLGQKFAMLEVKSVIAHVLYHFYLEPVQSTKNIKFTLNITVTPTYPLPLKFVKIERKSDIPGNVKSIYVTL